MKRRPELVVAALLLAGLGLSFGVAWLRSRTVPPTFEVESALPDEGLLFSLAAESLGGRMATLREFPLYRALVDVAPRGFVGRRIGWGSTVQDPTPFLPPSGRAALGIYREGWVLGLDEDVALPPGAAIVERRGFRLIASSPSLLRDSGETRVASERDATEPGSIHITLRPRALLGSSTDRFRLLLDRLVPSRAEGTIRVEDGILSERWTVSCSEGCIFDLLDPSADAVPEGPAWSVVPPGASAVTSFRFSPTILLAASRGQGKWAGVALLPELEQLESFLDLSIREGLASALRGSGIAAVTGDVRGGGARIVIGLDLASPDAARSLLDRIAAVGVLTGSISVLSYRGVPVASWSGSPRFHAIEPSAGIDGEVLLLALSPGDLEEAIDRRREGRREEEAEPLRTDLLGLPGGPWKGATRTIASASPWESLLRFSVPSGPKQGPLRVRAVLHVQDGTFILEGGGNGPAIAADGVTPVLALAGRGLGR